MEGKRQGNLEIFLRQTKDIRNNSTSGRRDISLTDMKSVFITDHPNKTNEIVVIVKRLPRSHYNDIGNPLARNLLHFVDFPEHLRSCEISHQSANSRSTEPTAHPAAHLRRDADAVSMFIPHQYALDHTAVPQFKKEFVRTVNRRNLPLHQADQRDFIFSVKLLPKGFGKICHLSKTLCHLHMNPLVNLLRPETFLPGKFHLLLQFPERIGSNIFFFHLF